MENYSDIAIIATLDELTGAQQKAEFLLKIHPTLCDTDPQRALRYTTKAVELTIETEQSELIALARYNHGEALLIASDAVKANEFFKSSLEYFRAISDKSRAAKTLNKIGAMYAKIGQYEQAVEYFLEAMQISRRLDNKLSYAHSLNNLGTCYRIQGNIAQALNFIRQSVDICRELNDKQNYSDMLCSLGIVYYTIGEHDTALEYYFQSWRLIDENEIRRLSRIFNNIGNVYYALERYQQALDFHEKALATRKKIGNRNLIGDSLNNCGNCYRQLGQMKFAVDSLTRAYEIKRRTGDARGEAYALSNLAKFFMDEGEFLKARQLFIEAIEVVTGMMGATEISTHAHLNLGAIAICEDDGKTAETHLITALELAHELKQPDVLRDVFKKLSDLYTKVISHKDRHKAREYFKRYTQMQEEMLGESKTDAVSRLEIHYNSRREGI
ncbi:MAG TPA: tetratricopeptide repeat protein [Patescibacteria group bacterium]|nr:tetratricopeptide repeat protein [Patescibacteria group bacterium]